VGKAPCFKLPQALVFDFLQKLSTGFKFCGYCLPLYMLLTEALFLKLLKNRLRWMFTQGVHIPGDLCLSFYSVSCWEGDMTVYYRRRCHRTSVPTDQRA